RSSMRLRKLKWGAEGFRGGLAASELRKSMSRLGVQAIKLCDHVLSAENANEYTSRLVAMPQPLRHADCDRAVPGSAHLRCLDRRLPQAPGAALAPGAVGAGERRIREDRGR